jgi:hypothetical protein
MSASQSRNYDRAQDISPRQMLILLEVSERTGADLGQVLATGEYESAHTWNDHVRPSLKTGKLGSATGVWQFQPATFHRIVKKFGVQLLSASEADGAAGRERLDLGDGPFADTQVRSLIQETVDGKRGAEDEGLQLLRHNFAVLAFAKHYLSLDSGATTPEEDYLFHFLGAGQGKRVLELARGEARDTLCVKPTDASVFPLEPDPPAGNDAVAMVTAAAVLNSRPPVATKLAVVAPTAARMPVRGSSDWALEKKLEPSDRIRAILDTEAALQIVLPGATEPVFVSRIAPYALSPASSEWGLPADSPTVTGNLGMFYRDGKGQTQPFTWAEFMENLARRIQADRQSELVRAKYGVGFGLKGGDMPHRAFRPDTGGEAAAFRHENGQTVLVPEPLVTGPLSPEEARQYKRRLAELVSKGEDRPTATLPPEALSALHHLTQLPSSVPEASTANPQVQKALHSFRKTVGKDEPDDPANFNLLMPAERIALEIYDQRLARYAALQAGQQASIGDAPNLGRIRKMPVGLRKLAAPHIAVLQRALAVQGLLTQPTRKLVWRDKKRKKHVDYKAVPFAGKVDKATVAAIDAFQWRNGLRKTQGVLDAVTLTMLDVPPMGPEIFLPLSGPQCVIDASVETVPICAIPTTNERRDFGDFIPIRPRPVPGLRIGIVGPDRGVPPAGSS